MITTFECKTALRNTAQVPQTASEGVDQQLAAELPICHMLARNLKVRCVIVQCGSLVLTLLPTDVEPGMTILYVTL